MHKQPLWGPGREGGKGIKLQLLACLQRALARLHSETLPHVDMCTTHLPDAVVERVDAALTLIHAHRAINALGSEPAYIQCT